MIISKHRTVSPAMFLCQRTTARPPRKSWVPPDTEKRGLSVGTGGIRTPSGMIYLFSSVGPTWVI